MPTKKRKLTQKERALVKALPEAKSQSEAAITAGYSPKNPDQSAYQALESIRKKMPELMDELGLTDTALIQKYLVPGLSASKFDRVKFLGAFGAEREDPDWGNRHHYLQTALKLRGHLGHDSEGGDTQSAGGGITVHLEFSDSGRARAVAATIAARRPGGRLIDVDAKVDKDPG